MAKATPPGELGRADAPGMPKLGLVPLDTLSEIVTAPVEDQTRIHKPMAIAAAPPANIVVVSATAGPDGLVPDDVGLSLAAEYRIDLYRRLRRADASGKPGEVTVIDLEDDITEQLVVLGLGDGSPQAARQAGTAMAGCIRGAERVLCAVTTSLSHESMRALCEGLLLASYRFSLKSPRADETPVSPFVQLAVAGVATSQPVLDRAVTTARSVAIARDMGNTPGNDKSPHWLAQRASALGAESGQRVTIFDKERLEREGFGGLLAVGSASANPPCLIMMDHRGESGAPHVVLIGKGVTFDSGGLSLKPGDTMPLMKTDMAGAASVLGVMRALPAQGLGVRVTALLPCAENMIGADAYRPGDVVTHFGGRTSEILNTDAEGRLLLADALAYATDKLRPDAIIDVATLTGAAGVALGRQFGALYSNDDGLSQALVRAGRLSTDRLWRMPLESEYVRQLDSSIADVAHTARAGGTAGSIVAALFLQQFVGDRRWAHLDIAGPARAEKSSGEIVKGATGFGVRVLLRWLESAPALW